jgi:transcriptional regulator with XRE-family HTH domain
VESSRRNPPRYAPDPEIARLRAAGWTLEQIAHALRASIREVYRWAAGDTRPLPIYARALAELPSERPASS